MSVYDLLLTGARVYVAPVGEALPDGNTIGVGTAWGGNWTDLGTISQALNLVIEEERHDFKDQRYMQAVGQARKSMVHKFASALGEVNAANVAYVQGYDPADVVTTTAAGASQIGHELVTFGSGSACARKVKEWAIGIEGVACTSAGDPSFLRVYLTKATFMPNGDQVFDAEGENVMLPFMATGLVDTAQPGGIPYRWERMTAVATS